MNDDHQIVSVSHVFTVLVCVPVQVEITLQDVNDNPPLFGNASYSATLPENAMTGTTVLKVCVCVCLLYGALRSQASVFPVI